MRLASFTAGPITVKSSRRLEPTLPYITSPRCSATSRSSTGSPAASRRRLIAAFAASALSAAASASAQAASAGRPPQREHRQQAVAQKLQDLAAMPLDRLDDGAEMLVEARDQPLGGRAIGDRGEAAQIGDDDRCRELLRGPLPDLAAEDAPAGLGDRHRRPADRPRPGAARCGRPRVPACSAGRRSARSRHRESRPRDRSSRRSPCPAGRRAACGRRSRSGARTSRSRPLPAGLRAPESSRCLRRSRAGNACSARGSRPAGAAGCAAIPSPDIEPCWYWSCVRPWPRRQE